MTVHCLECGKPFSILHYWIAGRRRQRYARVDKRRYCSPACGGRAAARKRVAA